MQSEASGADAGLIVNDVLDAYLKEHVYVKVADPDRQEYGMRHLKIHLGKNRVVSVDIPTCRKYVKSRLEEGAAASTARRELNILGAAANHCRKWRTLKPEHLPQIELPEVRESEAVQWFTKEQIGAMFEARKTGHFACFIRIAYYTAARRRSIQTLAKTQVNLSADVIHLAKPGAKVTKKRRPSVPIYPEIRPSVEWLLANSGTPHLFGRCRDFYRVFVELCEELGFEGHPHMLRHSRATHMLHDGESIFKVAKLLGDSVATVERVYGHSSVGFLASTSNVADAMLS